MEDPADLRHMLDALLRVFTGVSVGTDTTVLHYPLPKMVCEEAANLPVSHTACAGLAPGADKASRGIILIKSSCLFAYAMPMETIRVMPEHAGGCWKQGYGGSSISLVQQLGIASLWKQDLPSQLSKWSLSQISPLSPLLLSYLLFSWVLPVLIILTWSKYHFEIAK